MSGPVPSPSMKGMTGLSGTLSLPLLIVIFAPCGGVVSFGLAAVDMRNAPQNSPAASTAPDAQMLAQGRPRDRTRAERPAHVRDWLAATPGGGHSNERAYVQ